MKHDTPEKKRIADRESILRTQVGSGLHGVAIEGTDDRDEMGICIEPAEYVIGLRKFEQYEFRTQPEHARSGAGDLDLTVYSLRKWMRLALAGNPTVILPLFAPRSEVMEEYTSNNGALLRSRRSIERIISRQCADRFLGYLDNQRKRMMGELSQRTNRPELVEKYGYDTKFAMHGVRLGMQGLELLRAGTMTLPVVEEDRTVLMNIRHGVLSKDEVLGLMEFYESQIRSEVRRSPLREQPDYQWADAFLEDVYMYHWGYANKKRDA